ncbi:hypothetical protein ACQ4LE_004136, partial [Meloidogyne hapla]
MKKDAVSFYEYSRLYDRNQFVCVLNGEFGEQKGSGCVRKRSGHVRCWCFGRSNCNTPENSKLLYETFIGGDEKKFNKAVEHVDFVDLNDEEEEEEKEEIFFKNKNEEKINTTTLTNIKKEEEKLDKVKATKTTILMPLKGEGDEEEGKILKLENALYEASDWKKAMAAKTVHHHQQQENLQSKENIKLFSELSFKSTQKLETKMTISTTPRTTSETTQKSTEKILDKTTRLTAKSTSEAAPEAVQDTTPKTTSKTSKSSLINPSTVKTIYDSQNKVHVIHVSGRDRYDNLPVEQLLGSPAMRRIMEEEREKLKNKVEDNSAEEEDNEDDNLDEDEELDEDWEFEKDNDENDDF